MSAARTITHQHEADDSKSVLGFWIYLMTDCVLFASLFATYIVLHGNTFGGQGSDELFSMPYVLVETLLLLTSSFTCGLVILSAHQKSKAGIAAWLVVTFLLGAAFLGMELSEFANMVSDGNGWQRSGFLSGYFTLVGTHGLHISVGLLWIIILVTGLFRNGLTNVNLKRLTLFSLFWHFLDIVWIFIFTIVYLTGAL